MHDPCERCANQSHPRDERFYVSVQDAGRSALLLGPFSTHAEAQHRVRIVRRWCEDQDRRAVWYAFGTAGVKGRPYPLGTLNAQRATLVPPSRMPDGMFPPRVIDRWARDRSAWPERQWRRVRRRESA